MGQKTGMLKKEKNVQNSAISVARVSDNLQRWEHAGMKINSKEKRGGGEREAGVAHQNLNSGSLLMKGLNSSLLLVGN